MDPASYIDPALTRPDLIVLRTLLHDISVQEGRAPAADDKTVKNALAELEALNDPSSPSFEPSVTSHWDLPALARVVPRPLLNTYLAVAARVVRFPTDHLMVTHLTIYLLTSLPSAAWLLFGGRWGIGGPFRWPHGIAHLLMSLWYAGPYTLMMHQHIHMGGVLARKPWPVLPLIDTTLPYVLGPLMGHTWNSYYYHHVRHHHIEANGPHDLSSTIRYQRDNPLHFAMYFLRFFLFIWAELPLYFWRKGRRGEAARAFGWEVASYALMIGAWWTCDHRAVVCVLLLPFLLLRLGLMVGNWGQHALVDDVDPNSDFRSSITLIDVPSNRHSFNDGYHTSHHLNPRRHWRAHPHAFLSARTRYATEHALVLRNVDYVFLTIRLLCRDYDYLARCMVPISKEQMQMSMAERAELLRSKTKAWKEENITQVWGRSQDENEGEKKK